MNIASVISQNIRKRRKELGWSQQEAADRMKCTLRNYQHYENHSQPPNFSIGTLQQIANGLKFEFMELFAGVAEPSPSEKEKQELAKIICESLAKLIK